MRDRLGYEIVIGATVLWGGGKTQYAGLPMGMVTAITEKRVKVVLPKNWGVEGKEERTLDPRNVVVVDLLLAVPRGGVSE